MTRALASFILGALATLGAIAVVVLLRHPLVRFALFEAIRLR